MTRRQLQGFVIHRRAFKNTSFLVDCFTREEGVLRCVASGFRRKSKRQLPLFTQLWLEVKLNTELANLYQAEAMRPTFPLQGKALYCGLYLNELLSLCLTLRDAHPEIYHHYQCCLDELGVARKPLALQVALRRFEIALLMHLGFGIDFCHEHRGVPIEVGKKYRYQPGTGFIESVKGYHGAALIALATGQLMDKGVLRQAKSLLRQAIDELINYRPLKSRELFYGLSQ